MKKQILIQENSFEKARKKIRENIENTLEGTSEIIFSSGDDELNRKVLEKEKINILLINQIGKKDFQKQRDSGFNHVLAKIAKKNNVAIGINLDEIVNFNGKVKANVLARVKQNIRLCNKNKLKIKFIGEQKRNVYDLKSLGLVLGMPTKMISEL